MPEYEYRCKACRREFTVRKSMGEAKDKEPCPDCASEGIRQFSRPILAKFIPANPSDPEQWK